MSATACRNCSLYGVGGKLLTAYNARKAAKTVAVHQRSSEVESASRRFLKLVGPMSNPHASNAHAKMTATIVGQDGNACCGSSQAASARTIAIAKMQNPMPT